MILIRKIKSIIERMIFLINLRELITFNKVNEEKVKERQKLYTMGF